MDSYPSEFTAHPLPLLFVAGLLPLPPSPASSTSDPFAVLRQNLAKALASPGPFPLWHPARLPALDFHTLLVDQNARFPPLKARPLPPASPTSPDPPPPAGLLHSPISPLTPTSPLYPDGLIAPIWVRKHRELVPAVFVLVLRLYEPAPGTGAASLSPDDRADLERAADADLVHAIVDRRRATLERGIKLAVVLLCSRPLLDDPALDLRLSLLRRQSGLDSRASLFVLSPVPAAEVANFVHSLQQELLPAALDYYREHARRVRRKRTRPPVPSSAPALSERGWAVRYDYKLALFAEMRGELEVSLKHYEDCYEALVDLFGQPQSPLLARTKRWAEAKVLADCISIKISKMYLYLNDPARALAQLHRHVSRFRDLSSRWHIGEDTFEFWSWLSKQYRIFGDLVAVALRAGFRLPSLRPPPTPRLPPPGTAATAGIPPTASPGLVPLNVLQHAGHYYHLAGVCAVARRDRFREAVRAADAPSAPAPASGAETAQAPPVPSPALAHERKVDHGDLIVELFTKAYEFFKAHRAKNMTYRIAYEIAAAHHEAGKWDMAFKFYDRIAKSYRRDGWFELLDSILERAFRAAVLAEDWPAAIRTGLELLAPTSRMTVAQREAYAKEVLEILHTHPPSPEQARVVLDMTECAPLLDCTLVFLRPSVHTAQPVPFQLVLSAPSTSRVSGFTFSRLDLHFNDGRPAVCVTHAAAEDTGADGSAAPVSLGHVGSVQDRSARLRWEAGESRVLTGSVSVDRELDLTLDRIVLAAEVGGWTLEMTMQPRRTSADGEHPDSMWQVGRDRRVRLPHAGSICRVTRRELRMRVATECASPAYLDERFPVHVDVTNEDELEVQVSLVIFLQPGEEGSYDRLLVDDVASTSVIESLSLGTLPPGASLRKTFYLETRGGIPGPRNLDVTLHAVPVPPSSSPSAATSSASTSTPLLPIPTDTTRTLSIPVVRPLLATFETQILKGHRRPVRPLLDLDEPDGGEGTSEAVVVAGLTAAGPWELEVVRLRLLTEDTPHLRVVASSLGYLTDDDDTAAAPMIWQPGDEFSAIFTLEVQPEPELEPERGELPEPGTHPLRLEVEWRRRATGASLADSPAAPTARTQLRLAAPAVRPRPRSHTGRPLPTVTLRLPPYLHLHTPTTLHYRLTNPHPQLLPPLTLQLDSPDVPGTFAVAGPRRLPLEGGMAPYETRTVHVRVVPLVAGKWTLPRLRVWMVDDDEEEKKGHERHLGDDGVGGGGGAGGRVLELEVEMEGDPIAETDSSQPRLGPDLHIEAPGDDRDRSGPTGGRVPLGRAPLVLVLPRS